MPEGWGFNRQTLNVAPEVSICWQEGLQQTERLLIDACAPLLINIIIKRA